MSDGVKRLGPNLWHVRVKRFDLRTGLQRNLKRTVEGSQRDAIAVRDELRAELASTVAKPRRMRLTDYAASWLERRQVRDTTRRRYAHALLKIDARLGAFYLDALTPSMIQQYVTDRTREAAGYTVLNELRVLRTVAKDALAERLCEIDFTSRVPAPKVSHYTTEDPNLLTAPQFSAVLSHLPTKWHGLTLLMFTTGLRWGEASALQWEDLKEEDTIAIIRHGNDRGSLTEVKTFSSLRSVPILPEVLAHFGLRRDTGPVFRNRHGRMYASSAKLLQALKAAQKEVGVPFEVTVHGLRRTFNNLARKMTSREVLKSLTGHDTDEMVEHYSVIDYSEKTAASRSVLDSLSVPGVSGEKDGKGRK
jgi:integrase